MTACASGVMFQSVDWCAWFMNGTARILNLKSNNMSRLEDLTAVFLYSRGASMMGGGVNTVLRNSGGVGVPRQWRDQLVLTGSGLAALRNSPTVGDVGPRVVWRAEEPFPGAQCTWNNSAQPMQYLSGSLNVTGFESTTTSLPFADSWPFGVGASRILALWRTDPQGDGGVALGWLQSPFQREVTIPPPFTLHFLACEQVLASATPGLRKNVTVLHAILTTVTSPPPPQPLRVKALASLRKAFAADLSVCDELLCQFMCADSVSPQACTCVSATQCAPTRAGIQPMRIINEDWVLGRGTNARPTCLTNLSGDDSGGSDHLGMAECSVALTQRQSFAFVPVASSDLVTIRFRNASGLCLSNYGALFVPGTRLGLWDCNGQPDQQFRVFREWNQFVIMSARSFAAPAQPVFCATASDQPSTPSDVLFQPCGAVNQHFNAVRLDFDFH